MVVLFKRILIKCLRVYFSSCLTLKFLQILKTQIPGWPYAGRGIWSISDLKLFTFKMMLRNDALTLRLKGFKSSICYRNR